VSREEEGTFPVFVALIVAGNSERWLSVVPPPRRRSGASSEVVRRLHSVSAEQLLDSCLLMNGRMQLSSEPARGCGTPDGSMGVVEPF